MPQLRSLPNQVESSSASQGHEMLLRGATAAPKGRLMMLVYICSIFFFILVDASSILLLAFSRLFNALSMLFSSFSMSLQGFSMPFDVFQMLFQNLLWAVLFFGKSDPTIGARSGFAPTSPPSERLGQLGIQCQQLCNYYWLYSFFFVSILFSLNPQQLLKDRKGREGEEREGKGREGKGRER